MKKFLFLLSFSVLFAHENKMQIFQPISSTCPKEWLDEMEKIAKNVEIVTVHSNKDIKRNVGIPKNIQSCNTSFFNDYVFEGNVPYLAIQDFFKNIPKNAIGLSLPSYENEKKLKQVYIIFEDYTYEKFGKYN